ncbi:MAG: addiction module protein [Okeania sp. SIO3C4]|nr:addiction module protein [Okeania sp. SIO3B3]NER01962.1 addiction module protein [Okeania sp. SIO3C4]
MTNNYDEIFSAALSLPPGSRAMLAEHLLQSLDSQYQQQIDASWSTEVEKRLEEIEKAEVKTIPAEQVLQKLRSRNG